MLTNRKRIDLDQKRATSALSLGGQLRHLQQETLGGNPGGSLEATRRSFNKDFLLALAADFKKHGAAAIEKVRKQ